MSCKTPWLGTLSLAAAVALTAPKPAAAQATSYSGLCDASAAVSIGNDHFVVAEDEHEVLMVYRRGSPKAVTRIDLGSYLGNQITSAKGKSKIKEVDIEAAARIGNRIYWIASHARDSKGEVEPTRHRLFACEIVDSAMQPTIRPLSKSPYRRLLESLKSDKRFAVLSEAAALAPEATGGLNIEGLAAMPDGGLYIGFRNPRPQGKALVLPLHNAAALVDGSVDTPVFGDLIMLDLAGRGIRSMERVGNGYAIVAGPSGGGKGRGEGGQPAFALYVWSGAATAAPDLVPGVDFGALRPEALFELAGDDRLYVLSDDGDEPVGGDTCKKADAAKRWFRGMSITRPATLGRP